MALAHSLSEAESQFPLVVLVTDGVPQAAREHQLLHDHAIVAVHVHFQEVWGAHQSSRLGSSYQVNQLWYLRKTSHKVLRTISTHSE